MGEMVEPQKAKEPAKKKVQEKGGFPKPKQPDKKPPQKVLGETG